MKVDMKREIRDSEATIRDIIKHSEARTNNIINEMKVEMRESESKMRNNFKSDMKASELRIIQKIDANSEKKVVP
jgi:F0F1-type ATP synthase membrane subunit b/b'